MPFNFYDTHTLLLSVQDLTPSRTFLRDRYFPTNESTDIFSTTDVLAEYRSGSKKLAPFVASRKGGVTVSRGGYEMKRYTPPRVAPSRMLTIDDLTRRGFGEALLSTLTPEDRQNVLLLSDGTVYFATDETAVLQAGELYVDVTATCTSSGTDHNGYAAGSIGTLVDLIPYISSAENITTSAGGDDGEPYDDKGDERYRERIRLAPSRQSTAGPESAYRYFALSADADIIDVVVESPSAAVINIYPLMAGGELPNSTTLAAVQAAFSDDVRPMTDNVTVLAPTLVEYDISLKYYCTAENEASAISAVEGDNGAVEQYKAWQCEKLGRDINPDQLRRFLLQVDKVDRVDLTSPTYTEVASNKVARFSGNVTITHQVVG